MLVTCTRKKPLSDGSLCRNQWDYQGGSKAVAHCPVCKTTVTLTPKEKGRRVELRTNSKGAALPV